MARVSIIIPVLNAQRTIDRAIDSVLAQTMPDFELVIVDDGSTDEGFSRTRTRFASDPRFRFLGPRSNTGPSLARNAGVDGSTGEWIGLLDADDAWTPQRLDHLLSAAKDADLVADDIMRFDVGAGEALGPMFGGVFGDHLTLEAHLTERPRSTGDTGFLKPIMRRRFLDTAGLRYDADLRHGEDFVFYLECLCARARFRLIDRADYIYTIAYGSKSQGDSPYSHTVHNGAAMAAKVREVGDRYAERLNPAERQAIEARAAILDHIDLWWDFQAAFRARRPLRGLQLLGRSAFVRQRLRAALSYRLAPRRVG